MPDNEEKLLSSQETNTQAAAVKYTDGLTRKSDLMRIINYLMQIDI